MIFLRNFCFFFPRNVELTRESPNALLFESFEEKVVDVAKTLIGGVSDAPIRTVRGYKSKLIKEQKKKAAEEAAKKAKERLARIRPNDKMSYIYREKDGSVRLNVLVGGKKRESVKTVGDLVGQINKGCGRPTLQIVEKITKNRKRTVFLNSLFSNNFYPHLLASTANQEELVKKEKPQ